MVCKVFAVLLVLGLVAFSRAHKPHKKRNFGKHKIDLDKDDTNMFNELDFLRDKDHILEHMEDNVKLDPDKISPAELDFHFFKIHDTDGDHHLDGLEILAALTHAVDEQLGLDGETQDSAGIVKQNLMKHLTSMVDRILLEDDKNGDGFLSYAEYASARQAISILRQAGTAIPGS